MIKHRYFSGFICILLISVILGFGMPVIADSISDLEGQISEEEQKLKEAQEKKEQLEALYAELEKEMEASNEKLDRILEEMNALSDRMEEENAAQEYYAALEAELDQQMADQREAMARRIQYMYEQQSSTMWDVLAGASTLGDVMNAAEYFRSITEYDQKMLNDYTDSWQQVRECQAETAKRQDELSALEDKAIEHQKEYIAVTEDLDKRMNACSEQMKALGEQAESYRNVISQKQAALKRAKEEAARAAAEAAAKKAREEAARKEAEAKAAKEAAEKAAAEKAAQEAADKAAQAEKEAQNQAGTGNSFANNVSKSGKPGSSKTPPQTTASDRRGVGSTKIDPDQINPSGYTNLELLASIIECEAGGQSPKGRMAVGTVIMNRILDPRFQMTLYDVIWGPGQFTPVTSGALAASLAKGARASCVETAKAVLNGETSIPSKYLYFCSIRSWNSGPHKYKEYFELEGHIYYYN